MGKGFSKEFLQSVRSHHENYNGSGYPDNLAQTDIPSYASILRIIDSYDAMTNHRSYNKIKTSQEAVCEMASLKGEWYHPGFVEIFTEFMMNEIRSIE